MHPTYLRMIPLDVGSARIQTRLPRRPTMADASNDLTFRGVSRHRVGQCRSDMRSGHGSRGRQVTRCPRDGIFNFKMRLQSSCLILRNLTGDTISEELACAFLMLGSFLT